MGKGTDDTGNEGMKTAREYEGIGPFSDPGDFDPLFDDLMLADTSDESRLGILRSVHCLRGGDLRGAVLAAIGAVDALTEKIYREKKLGDPHGVAFKEKVTRCIDAVGDFDLDESYLMNFGWEEEEARIMSENLRSILSDGAEVMQKLGANMEQTGESTPPEALLVANAVRRVRILLTLLQGEY